jgi:hypothetical protein
MWTTLPTSLPTLWRHQDLLRLPHSRRHCKLLCRSSRRHNLRYRLQHPPAQLPGSINPVNTSDATTPGTPAADDGKCDDDINKKPTSSRFSQSSTTSCSRSSDLPKAYHSIRAARIHGKTVRTLSGSAVSEYYQMGSFEKYIGPISVTPNYRFCYKNKLNISTSFLLDKFTCNTCVGGEHQVLGREVVAGGKNLAPVAFVLSDQNFPPVLPAEEGRDCIKIFLVEDGTLHELVSAFLEATRGFRIPAGTVVLLSSASYLAWVGTAAYLSEFVSARRRLLAAFGGALEVIHGVPVLCCGITDSVGIRSLHDCTHWLQQASNTRHITDTMAFFMHEHFVKGVTDGAGSSVTSVSGSSLTPDPIRMLLPVDIEGKTNMVFDSKPSSLPNSITCDNVTAMRMLDCLREELNTKFLSELGPIIWDEYQEDDSIFGPADDTKFIVVGGSHAGRIAEALDKLGYRVADLSEPGWRVNVTNVDSAAESLRDCIAEDDRGKKQVIVYWLLDNSCYYACSAGRRSLPARGNDRKYHITGKLDLADRGEFKELFNNCVSLIRAGGDCQKVLVTPLGRYITDKCCGDSGHITNFADPGYVPAMGTRLEEFADWVKALAFTKRIRNFKILNPNNILGIDFTDPDEENSLTELWPKEPVHLAEFAYDSLADHTAGMAAERQFNRAEAQSADSGKRSKPRAERRESWVTSDEAVATRTDSRGKWPPNRGRGRGFHFKNRGSNAPGRGRGKWSRGFRPY